MDLHLQELYLLPPVLHPLPPPMQQSPSLTPLLHLRPPHHLRGCAQAAASHPATTHQPRV